jgi:hypothetical protein
MRNAKFEIGNAKDQVEKVQRADGRAQAEACATVSLC